MGLLKKEEKLLKRLFQKRRNELRDFISNNIKTLDKIESKALLTDSLTITMNRHQKELSELNQLEQKIFTEIEKYGATNDTRKAT